MSTPFTDLNGRCRTALGSPQKPVKHEDSWEISAPEADKIRKKLAELPELRQRAKAAEEKAASQEKTIQQLQKQLAKTEPKRSQKDGEKTMELAAIRMELHQTQQQLDCKDSTQDHILAQLVESRLKNTEGCMRKDVEIERLRRELDDVRAEVVQLKPELREAQQRLEDKEVELERMLPEYYQLKVHDSQRTHSKDAEMTDLRRELEKLRADLAGKELELQEARRRPSTRPSRPSTPQISRDAAELQQARQDLQNKNAEIDEIRRERDHVCAELAAAHAELSSKRLDVEQARGKHLELLQARQDLELTVSENDQLRRELDQLRERCAEQPREIQRLRTEPSCTNKRVEKVYEQALLSKEEEELKWRMAAVEMREQAVTLSEGYLHRNIVEPVVVAPIRAVQVSRPLTPPRFQSVISLARTPPVTPPRTHFNGGGGSGIPFTGQYRPGPSLLDRLGW